MNTFSLYHRKKKLCAHLCLSVGDILPAIFLSTSCQLPTKFLFSSEKICADNSQYVEIKIISV